MSDQGNPGMADMILNASVVDGILSLIAFEAMAVLGWRALTSRGPQPLPFISNLLAGAFLLIALRGALSDAAPSWIAACLFAGFLAHFADLTARWNDSGSPSRQHPAANQIRVTVKLHASPSHAPPSPPMKKDEASNG